MPKLSLSLRVAAGSMLLLSLTHIFFWISLALGVFGTGLNTGQFTLPFVAPCLIAVGGTAGVLVALGIFKAEGWARVAALAIAAIVAFVCAFALLVLVMLILGDPANFGFFGDLVKGGRSLFMKVAGIYFLVLSVAVWWILLFSRGTTAAQFSAGAAPAVPRSFGKQPCPPPIALLAWLMILSGFLSAVSWSLILGKIPAMLFNHIFSSATSRWIWIANIVLALACGVGLLRLQRWSYTGAIAWHIFWLVSAFTSQLSVNYETYTRLCLDTLNLGETYPILNRLRFSPWVSAGATAIPTALLIAGLFYYRRLFLKAASPTAGPSSS